MQNVSEVWPKLVFCEPLIAWSILWECTFSEGKFYYAYCIEIHIVFHKHYEPHHYTHIIHNVSAGKRRELKFPNYRDPAFLANQKGDFSFRTKKQPEGEPLGSSANLTGLSAPSSTDKWPVLQLISVLTLPGQTQLMQIVGNFFARILVYAFIAAFEIV